MVEQHKPVAEPVVQAVPREHVVVERSTPDVPADREGAFARLRAGIARMHFRAGGPLPTRDELHER